ncbi:MAG TPA: hemerythrin domain-containing protein [Candidatus Kryptobacter bacterium]|nr:hemerythrin domain-containing protein [Candidatus Kryptobacter bacterium]
MTGPLCRYLFDDHERMDALLNQAVDNPEAIDMKAYTGFRQGLLRHIGIEEKIVLPAIARLQDGAQAEVAARLRLDHGALVALLVPPPTPAIVETIRSILSAHNPLEENEGGLYQLLDRLAGEEAGNLLARLKGAPEVPALPHNDRPGILDVTRRAVERAGYKAAF